MQQSDWGEGVRLLVLIAPGWCMVGIGLATWIEIVGARLLRPAFLVASILRCAIVLSALWSLLFGLVRVASDRTATAILLPNGLNWLASYLYQMWVVIFYGGLYFFVWALNHRAERTRKSLNEAHLARMRTETLLGEAQINALREYVDPRFLLRVVNEVERRYTMETESANQLVGRFVSFLRLAMPGVRTGRSSLTTELELTRIYAALRADAERMPMLWRVTSHPSLPDVPMPPLILFNLLESAAAASGDAQISLDATSDGERILLSVHAPACRDWLTPDRAYRLRVGLSTLYGSNWSLEVRPPTVCAASLPTLSIRVSQSQARETIDA